MESEIIVKTNDELVISWSADIDFGQLSMKWNQELGVYILDSELTSIDTVIKIFKSLK